jgi:RNA polymerase sigma-54 factor
MIDKEGKTPLTDREIADILKKEGIDISRRTVDKYRNQMGISSSRERKRERKLYE